jgi:hypothetical protein
MHCTICVKSNFNTKKSEATARYFLDILNK